MMDPTQPTKGTNWAALRATPDAEIEQIAAEDRDNPASDETHWATATVGLPSTEPASDPEKRPE